MCPLCNQPVPTGKGEDPNIKASNDLTENLVISALHPPPPPLLQVDTHIQNECKSEKAKKVSDLS